MLVTMVAVTVATKVMAARSSLQWPRTLEQQPRHLLQAVAVEDAAATAEVVMGAAEALNAAAAVGVVDEELAAKTRTVTVMAESLPR